MSPSFNTEKAYVKQGDVFFDDGRETDLLHYVYSKPDIDQIRGDPKRVLQAIDEYGRTQKYLMNVGEDKGRIVTDLIGEIKPRVMVELGGYIGYSCILFGAALHAAGGQHYYSLERNPLFGAVIMALVDLAGLSETIKVIIGPSAASLKHLHATGALKKIDILFLDHYKPAYTSDLKLCESLGLVGPGSVLAADNVVKPGNPPYLEYVRATVREKRDAVAIAGNAQTRNNGDEPAVMTARDRNAHEGVDERFSQKYANQYARREGVEKLDMSVVGNPNLVYESRLAESFEPTGVPDGVEISRCIAEEA